MEGEEEQLTSPSQTKTFSEWADELCPYYMALGVTYDEYWHGNYAKLPYYVAAHELYREQKNQEMYLQGLYEYEAFHSVISEFSWNMGGKKGQKPKAYRDYPIAITEREKSAEKQRSIKQTLLWVEQGQKE